MAIRVVCPNSACGKVLAVEDAHAGKKGKCPACGSAFSIPGDAGSGVFVAPSAGPEYQAPSSVAFDFDSEPGPPAPARPRKKPAVSKPAPVPERFFPEEDEEDYADVTPDVGDEEMDEDEEEDEEEEVDEEEADYEKRSLRRRQIEEEKARKREERKARHGGRRTKASKSRSHRMGIYRPETSTVVCLGIAILLLIGLGLTPLFDWMPASVKGPGEYTFSPGAFSTPTIHEWVGKVILGVSVVMAVLAAVAIVLLYALEESAGNTFLAIVCGLAGGWGLTAVAWLFGVVWKVFYLASKYREAIAGLRNRPVRQMGSDSFGSAAPAAPPLPAGSFDMQISMYPYVALWLGLAAALLVAVLLSYVAATRRRKMWSYVAEGIGLLIGIFLLILNVRPLAKPLLPF